MPAPLAAGAAGAVTASATGTSATEINAAGASGIESSVFGDVPAGQWYAEAVAWAAANGIVSGFGGGIFGPNEDVTREQLAAILLNYAGHKKLAIANTAYRAAAYIASYADIDTVSDWAQEAMKWANSLGLINGRTANTLAPRGTATRAEVAAILQRFIMRIAAT